MRRFAQPARVAEDVDRLILPREILLRSLQQPLYVVQRFGVAELADQRPAGLQFQVLVVPLEDAAETFLQFVGPRSAGRGGRVIQGQRHDLLLFGFEGVQHDCRARPARGQAGGDGLHDERRDFRIPVLHKGPQAVGILVLARARQRRDAQADDLLPAVGRREAGIEHEFAPPRQFLQPRAVADARQVDVQARDVAVHVLVAFGLPGAEDADRAQLISASPLRVASTRAACAATPS